MNADTTLPGQGRRIDNGETTARGGPCARVIGGALVGLGGLILMHQLGLMHSAEWRYIWPIGFVALGAILLLRRP